MHQSHSISAWFLAKPTYKNYTAAGLLSAVAIVCSSPCSPQRSCHKGMAAGLSVYRQCLRSVQQSFRGDQFMLHNSRKELRSKFEANRHVSDSGAVKKLLAEGEEAADFIKTFVVQAKLNERGNFEMKVQPHHADATAEEAALRR